MKYIYSTVIFIAFLFTITVVINFKYVQEVENVDLSQNEITKISVDLIDTNIALSTTIDKDINIEHIYSKEEQPTSNIYSYQDGDTLIIKEYPYNKPKYISKKETVNIYIPEEYDFDKLDIKTNNGQINVDSLSVGNLNVDTDSGNLDIAGVKASNIMVSGNQFGVNLSNVVAKKFDSEIDKMSMKINNSIIDNVYTASEGLSSLAIAGLVTNEVNIGGESVIVDLNLNQSLDYRFFTPATIGEPSLVQNEDGYEYLVNNSKSIVTYNIPDSTMVTVVLETIEDENETE